VARAAFMEARVVSEPSGAGGRSPEERLRVLAAEKANLDLMLRLIERLNPLESVDDHVHGFLADFVETIGGTDARLYYWDEGQLRHVGLQAKDAPALDVEHPLAREAASRRVVVEQLVEREGASLLTGACAPAYSWAIPLLARGEVIGVVVIDNLHVPFASLGRYLPAVFEHAALILCNELRRRSAERAVEAQRESAAMFATSFQLSPDAMCVTDAETGTLVAVNGAFTRMAGCEASETIGRAPLELGEIDGESLAGYLAQRAATGRVRHFELPVRLRTGERRRLDLSSEPMDLGGRPRFLTIARDVTERIEAERALRENEERLRILADGLPGGLVFQLRVEQGGRARRFTYMSAGVASLHGLDAASALRDPLPLFRQLEEPGWARLQELLDDALARGSPIAAELRYRPPGCGARWSLLRTVPRRTPDGAVLWDGVEIDVTERKLAEEERHRLQLLLLQSQKMEAVGQLASGVAHDFSNLLGVILLNLEMLGEQDLPAHTRDELEQASDAVNRGVALSRQLLVFSRREVPQPRPVELHALFGNLLRMLRRMIGETIALELAPWPEDLWLDADPGMIEQVIMNLVVNARDAMPGGGRVTLRTEVLELGGDSHESPTARHPAARAGCFVLIEVRDTGIGMDEATAKRAFEPFFTTKETGRGTALGLATVHDIVEQHHGWVELETAPGRGSTFRVILPRMDGAPPDSAEAIVSRPTWRRGRERVLVVEDDPAFRRVVSSSLERLGYIVATAAHGDEAVERWAGAARELDLVLSDVVLPGTVSGPELVAFLRRHHPGLKAVLMSGYSADTVGIVLPTDGSVRFLQKPIPSHVLTRTIREALDER
jgi:PAS domain S-box-containing protein